MGRSKGADNTDKTCNSCKRSFVNFKRRYHRCGSELMCELCGSSFKKKLAKDKHDSEKKCTPQEIDPRVRSNTFVTCQGCQRSYIPHHLGKHRCDATDYCKFCGCDFSTKERFIEHVSKKGACLKFANQSYKDDLGRTAKEYLEGLDEDVKKRKTCELCNEAFPYFNSTDHVCKSTHMCHWCGASFKNRTRRTIHLHDKRCKPLIYCHKCGIKFRSDNDYASHLPVCQAKVLKDVSTLEKFVTCHTCKHRYIPDLRATHRCKRNFECPLCGRDFINKWKYNRHVSKNGACLKFANQKDELARTSKEYLEGLDEDVKKILKDVSTLEKFVTCHMCKHRYIPDPRATHRCKRNFVCCLCGRDFFKKRAYTRHLSKEGACLKFVESQKARKIKEKRAHIKKGSKTTCPRCRKTFVNFRPKLHKCYAKNMCIKCGYAFSVPHLLKEHKLKRACSSKNPCKYCGTVFSTVQHVLSHQMVCRSKPPVEELTCKSCNHKYHSDVNHQCSFKITCGECGRKFDNHLKRARHVMLGSCNAIKTCNGCGNKYKSPMGLPQHLLTCYKWKYNSGQKLPDWKAKLGVTEDKINKCPVCWKSFTDLETLDRHLKEAQCQNTDRDGKEMLKNILHLNNKFFCPLCIQVYDSKSQLECHTTLQSCLAIPRCDNCGNCFKDGGFEEHVLLDLCTSGKSTLKQQKKPPQIPESTPAGYCSFCFKLLLKGEATEHLKTCPDLTQDKIPTCPFGSCEFSSPLCVFLHTANLKDTSCSKWGYPCGKCAFITISKESAVSHAKAKHNLDITLCEGKIDSGFACFVCNKKFYDDEDSARFHTSACSQTFGLCVRVDLKRCSDNSLNCEVPAKQVKIKNEQPEGEKEYVPSLVLVTTENYMKL